MFLSLSQLALIQKHLGPIQPAVMYLFGSAVAGRLRPDSDLDLAVLPSESIAPERLFRLQTDLAEALGIEVDLVDLSRATTVLRKEVLAGGRVIYETDAGRRAEFEMYALSDYARLNEERAEVLAAWGQPLPSHA